MIGARRFQRRRDGRYQLRLSSAERSLLAALPGQALPLVEAKGPDTVRLFPPAYPGEPRADEEYRSVVGGELLKHHKGALAVLQATANSAELAPEELEQWASGLEVLRLVLGTQLDVSDDGEVVAPPPTPAPGRSEADAAAMLEAHEARVAVYRYLSMLQAEVVDVLAASLPAKGY